MHQNIGRELYAAGWTQGVLFAPVALSVVFAPDSPVSKLAKAAAAKSAPDEVSSRSISHGVASGIPASTERLVLVSQPCDIVKPLNDEPNVFAYPVFRTENERILRPASKNSTRYFLVDSTKGYVADATSIVVIEKPLLLALNPEVGIVADDACKRFARWVARRFNRPAIPDEIVAAIVKPILENLRAMQEANTLDIDLLDQVAEVRIRVLDKGGKPPFHFELMFITDGGGAAEIELALAPLVGSMRTWFHSDSAILNAWYARGYDDVTVADYLEFEQISLEEYSYSGGSVRGLIAAAPE